MKGIPMTTPLNLKEIERRAFRSTYQDGLWDMYLGLIVVCMSVFVYRPADGYSPVNLVLAMLAIFLAHTLFWAGKKYITLPRMGQARFGVARKRKKRTLAIILSVVILIQAGIVGLTVLAWANPDVGAKVNDFFKTRDLMDLVVAAIGSLFVGPSMILIAYFSDFPRGYYIAVMMSVAVFLMISLNQPVYPIIIGGLILLPGLVLFVRFLKTCPRQQEDASYG
jgi:Ca2+/Na+ antiporter